MNDIDAEKVIDSPEFKALLKARYRLALPIAATIITAYFGFILMVAFKPSALGITIGGGHVSIGIYAGLALLLLSFALTAIYIRLSDGDIATLQKKIQDKYK